MDRWYSDVDMLYLKSPNHQLIPPWNRYPWLMLAFSGRYIDIFYVQSSAGIMLFSVNYNDLTATEPWNHG